MFAPVSSGRTAPGWRRYSALRDDERRPALTACREVAESLYPGLDLTDEIHAVHERRLGDTILIEGVNGIEGFAICHYGPSSEAGVDACLIKFAAVRDMPSAAQAYSRLLDACEVFAAAVTMPTLWAGANLARREAYEELVRRGFRTAVQGVAMHRDNEPGYCRPGVYVIDDWR
jgi:hypothetical protein